MKIKTIELENFKSIVDEKVIASKIVGIWGRNGSGKSSLLQAILWVLKNSGSFEGGGLRLGNHKNCAYKHNTLGECKVEILVEQAKGEFHRYFVRSPKGQRALQNHGKSHELIKYFPPWRHIASRSYQIAVPIEKDVGLNASAVHSTIHWFLHELLGKSYGGNKEAEETLKRINDWAKRFGLGRLLDKKIGDNLVSGTYEDPEFAVEVDIIDGGYGG